MSEVALGIRLSAHGVEATQAGVSKVGRALGEMGRAGEASAGQIRQAMRMLPAQLTDVATGLAGGQSPLTVLLQQGGQLRDQFGSVGAVLRGVGSAVISALSNPVTVAAAAVAGLVYVMHKGAEQASAMARAVASSGNAAGLTADRYDELTKRVAQAVGGTVGGARAVTQELVKTGRIGSQAIESMAIAVERESQVSGRSAQDVAKDFAAMAANVADWAAEHNKAWNFITAAEYRYIKQLEERGDAEKAMILVSRQRAGQLQAVVEDLGYVESAWRRVATAAGDAWDAFIGLGKAKTLGQRMAEARAELAAVEQRISDARSSDVRAAGIGLAERDRQEIRQRIANLGEMMRMESRAADSAARAASMERAKIKAIRDADSGGRRSQYTHLSSGFVGPPTLTEMFPSILDVVDPHGDFIRAERGATGDVDRAIRESAAEREQNQRDLLEQITQANVRANLDLITDDRQRALAQIDLERETMRKRIALVYGASAERQHAEDAAEQLFSAKAHAALLKHSDAESSRLSDSIADGILDGFRRGGSFADIFLAELKAQFAKTVLSPMIRPIVDAGTSLIADLLKGLGGALSFGGGATGATGDFARFDRAYSGPLASGGRAEAGGLYLVGEHGPEMLAMGSRAGTVIPNGELRHVSGGGYAPSFTFHIDGRSDREQVAQLVQQAVADGQRQSIEYLRSRGLIR